MFDDNFGIARSAFEVKLIASINERCLENVYLSIFASTVLFDFVFVFVPMLVFVFVFVSMLLFRWPIVAGAANCDELQLDHRRICSVDICKVQNAKLARNGWKEAKERQKSSTNCALIPRALKRVICPSITSVFFDHLF